MGQSSSPTKKVLSHFSYCLQVIGVLLSLWDIFFRAFRTKNFPSFSMEILTFAALVEPFLKENMNDAPFFPDGGSFL